MLRIVLAVTTALALVLAAPIALADTVPDVVGLSKADAEGLIEEAGFTAAFDYVPGRAVDRVVSQDPGGFATRDAGTTITIKVVAATPKPGPGRTLPPSDPRPPSDAPPRDDGPPAGTGEPDLGAPPPGMPDSDPLPPSDDPEPAGPDVGTPPMHGALVYEGRPLPTDRLPGRSGPALPSVLGQPAQQAQAALRNWQVSVEYTLGVPTLVGKVVNQRPVAGQPLAAGEAVTLVVAVTQAPARQRLSVPQVERTDWRSAIQAVKAAGLGVAPTQVPSSAADFGLVVWQKPLPGSLAASGDVVRLRIGGGTGDRTPMPISPPVDEPPTDMPPTDEPPTGIPPADEPPSPGAPSTLAAPAPTAPPAGESYPHRFGATFQWSTIEGASAYEWELQEQLPSGAWQKVDSRMVSGTRFRPEKMDPGRFRWRVRAVQGSGKSAWSLFQRLYMY
jgi:beta-lactam-binding protein with PASTA domain